MPTIPRLGDSSLYYYHPALFSTSISIALSIMMENGSLAVAMVQRQVMVVQGMCAALRHAL